jgi:hypothetical protein
VCNSQLSGVPLFRWRSCHVAHRCFVLKCLWFVISCICCRLDDSIPDVLVRKLRTQINLLSIHCLLRGKERAGFLPQRRPQRKICLQLKWTWSVMLVSEEAIDQINSCGSSSGKAVNSLLWPWHVAMAWCGALWSRIAEKQCKQSNTSSCFLINP